MMPSTNSGKTPKHITGLRRFALAITVLNILGHTVLGFEQSWAQPLVALATAYSVELLLVIVDKGRNWRQALFNGGCRGFIDSLLSAHITGLAVAMLLFANERLEVICFAAAVAIGSKAIFRVPLGKNTRHFLNPSNFGITATLLLFPFVGVVPPYHFSENLHGWFDWLLPVVIICTGSLLNSKLTGRMPLIGSWLGGFLVQGLLRYFFLETPLTAALMPMTGVAFILFTFYMVTDPATTPDKPREQILFGAAVASVYGLLVANHVVFGLFFALTLVCAARGLGLFIYWLYQTIDHPTGVSSVRTPVRNPQPGLPALTRAQGDSLSALLPLLPLVVALSLLVGWALLSQLQLLPPAAFPTLLSVVTSLGAELQSGRLMDDVIASMFRVSSGFMLAVVLGVPGGMWLGHSAPARTALLPGINFMRSLSPVAWIPFAILWFGIGDAPVVFLIFMATVFPLTLATAAAVANIPLVYFRVAQDYGFRGIELLTQVTLPAILPQIITALRVTMGLAWLVVVAAEMIAGRDGLGFLIWDARNGLRMDLLAAGMIVIGLIGVLLDRIMICLTTLRGVQWGYER